jgi:hypothetical protein
VVAGIGFLGQELSFPVFCVVVIGGVLLPSLVHYNLSRINVTRGNFLIINENGYRWITVNW